MCSPGVRTSRQKFLNNCYRYITDFRSKGGQNGQKDGEFQQKNRNSKKRT